MPLAGFSVFCLSISTALNPPGVLPYKGYIGMRGPKGYSFLAALVINRVSIIAILPPMW